MHIRALAALVTLAACQSPHVKVDGARLADADAVLDPPASAPLVTIPGDGKGLETRGPVRLAVDWATPLSDVQDVVTKIRSAGGEPVFLVARRRSVKALPPMDPRADKETFLHIQTNGEFVVTATDVPGKTTVKGYSNEHIQGAHVKAAVRKAIEEYAYTHVHIVPLPQVQWGDIVRAVDGARTAPLDDTVVTVSVEGF